MASVVIGTAGHIDHGKTSLLRAVTGIDADRLPEERERGLTIDVGYAHLDLEDGSSIDFVDVPGHERYVGNMLVGAGEIDAALLVVAADDGPRPQTLEHLQLLDALGIRDGIAVVTKVDAVPTGRADDVAAEVEALLARTTLAGSPVLTASSTSGAGIDGVRARLVALRDRVRARSATAPAGPVRLALDRAFAVKGRGAVVTGSLRGGTVSDGDRLRLEPRPASSAAPRSARVRGLHVHNRAVATSDGGRLAVNVAGVEVAELRRGQVLTRGAGMEPTRQLVASIQPVVQLEAPAAARRTASPWPPRDGTNLRLHIGTSQVDAVVRRRASSPAAIVELRLAEPVATFIGDRAVLRRPSPGDAVAGVVVLDPAPVRGPARRRATPARLADLETAVLEADAAAATDALLRLHGALPLHRVRAVHGALRATAEPEVDEGADRGALVLAPDVIDSLEAHVLAAVIEGSDRSVVRSVAVAEIRASGALVLRRLVAIDRASAGGVSPAVDSVIEALVARGRLAKDADRVRPAGAAAGAVAGAPGSAAASDTDLEDAMVRLERALAVPAPPPLLEAARLAGCPPEGVSRLVADGRLIRLDRDLAWARPAYHGLARIALDLATEAPLTPAAFRDATGTSRRFVLAILEDLDRREILRRTADGHVPGPRAPKPAARA